MALADFSIVVIIHRLLAWTPPCVGISGVHHPASFPACVPGALNGLGGSLSAWSACSLAQTCLFALTGLHEVIQQTFIKVPTVCQVLFLDLVLLVVSCPALS